MTERTLPAGWTPYYDTDRNRPPARTLLGALERFEAEPVDRARFAVDLGCGDGRDTVELLRRGWRVLAMDSDPDGIGRLQSRTAADDAAVEIRLGRFEDQTGQRPTS